MILPEAWLAAAQQNGHLRRVSNPHLADGPMSARKLVAIVAGQASDGRGWARRLMRERLTRNRPGHASGPRLEALDQ